MSKAGYQYFQHTADIGLEARAPELAEVFAAAAEGMLALIVDPATIRRRRTWFIRVAAPDHETLLVRWLNEVLFRYEAKAQALSGFRVSISEDGPMLQLTARASGERLDPSRHRPQREVKAATYHGLYVGPVPDGSGQEYLVRVIFDL